MSADKKLTELTLLSATKSSDLMYIVTYIEGVAVSRAITTLALLQNTITGVNRIIGGQVVWTGVGFVHRSVQLLVELNGIIYFSNDEEITNDAPDGSNPRFDQIFFAAEGLGIKKGTPAGSPTVPSLDNPDSEIGTNIVLVTNGETTPTGVTLATVYSENLQESGGEWDTFESTTGARIDLANTSNPINGTKDIKAIAPEALDFFNFNHSVAVQIEDFQSLQFKIKSLGNWKADYIRVEFYDGVNFAGYTFINSGFFNTKDTTTIVNFVITKDNISWTVDFVEFDIIRFMWFDGGGGSAVSSAKFQIDVIKLEAGGITTDPISDLSMDVMKNMTNSKTTPIDADNLTLWDSVTQQFNKLSFPNLITYLDGFYSSGAGDMLLAAVQIVTGAKTFRDAKLLLRNVANTFNGVFSNTNTADRTYTLPDKDMTVAGTNDIPTVSDTAYNATSWDGNTDAATKNAIRDKIETLGGGGDVTGPGSATDENIVVFDSTTGKIIKDSGINQSAVTANTAKDTNVSTDLSEGTSTETTVDVNSSDGNNATLASASTSRAGLLTKVKWDEIVANTSKTSNANHSSEVTGDTDLTIASDVVDRDNLADDLKKVLTVGATGATQDLDWDLYSGFIITMDEECTFSDLNLPSSPDEDQITIKLKGDFGAILPDYWNVGGNSYNGVVWNQLAIECKDDTEAAEHVVCIITNLTT